MNECRKSRFETCTDTLAIAFKSFCKRYRAGLEPTPAKELGKSKQLLTLILLFVFSFLIPSAGFSSEKHRKGNGKKVYADYHGVRYTREHDGMLGRWEMFANTEKSVTGRKTLCYNADIILENGQHQIAATAYPQVGMQSNLDPDYLEYQILSAKAAKIDGFFIEWGFMLHENDILLKAMQKVAARYNFEIGVNWCDGWLYYNWITNYYPEINNREKKTEHYVKCYQYLIDSIFTGPTAPVVNGRPVFYLFGPGAKPEEFKWITSQLNIPKEMKTPAVLRRWADWGRLENNRYIPVTKSEDIDSWVKLGAIPTAWLPARVRTMDKEHPHWDNYALPEDLIAFMKPFRDSIWNSDNSAFDIKSGFVMPGMDNSGCAGWGRGHFYYIPRNNGETYQKMWDFNLENKNSLNMIFIASWSDYTEGHEIEPTIENGDRELRNTLTYAARFKGEVADENGIALPLQLFGLRKQNGFITASGLNTSSAHQSLDKAAIWISKGKYSEAKKLLGKTEKELKRKLASIRIEPINITEENGFQLTAEKAGEGYDAAKGISILFTPELSDQLDAKNYKGFINFEYLDEGSGFISLRSETKKLPGELFKTVAKIKKDNTGVWKKAKVELYKSNILYKHDKPTFRFTGNGAIRNISFDYDIYHKSNN